MKKIIKRLSGQLKNLPLQGKILLLVAMILSLTTLGSIGGFRLIYSSGNKMLYESLAGSLSYSAASIVEKLENIEAMTGIMLADSKVQSTLAVVADEADDTRRNDAYRTLSYLVPDYYQNFKQNGIHYMNLYNNNYVTYSYLSRSSRTPDAVHQQVIESAHNASGAPAWCTDYCNEYGLFLGRDIRRADQLKLDTLGTMVVSVDLEEIISSSTRHVFQSGTAEYVLYQSGKEIYHSSALGRDLPGALKETADRPYGIIKLEGVPFFYTKGAIPEYGWEYLCLSSYEAIAKAQRLYIALSALVILAVLLLGFLLSKLIIRSITVHFERLLKKMKDFGQDESVLPATDYDYTNRDDEIGELHRQFDQMAQKVQNLIQKNYVNELLTKEAQFKSLENQINPHFLYNTLEALNWQATAIGAKEISAMVAALGSLLRTTLSQKEGCSTVRRELKIVDDYMTIIKIRFDERIQYTADIPEALYDIALPRLTLQPLVENAVNYALEEIAEACTIAVTGTLESENAVLKVVNSGSQFPPDLLENLSENKVTPHGFGIGLLNIHKRLQLQFGAGCGLTLINEDEDHAAVLVTLPAKSPRNKENSI